MSEITERVARAICEAEKMNPDDALGGWIHWKEAAHAAIDAARGDIDWFEVAGEQGARALRAEAELERLRSVPRCDRCGSSGDVFMMCAGCQSPMNELSR